MSQADAIQAASAFLQRRDIVQGFASQDGTASYTLDELNAILKKENFLQCKDNQWTLMLPLSNGVTSVSKQAVEGMQLLAGCQDGVPVINVLANTIIGDGTVGERQLTSLSVKDLARLEKDSSKSFWGALPTGHDLTSLMVRAKNNLNQFVDKDRQQLGPLTLNETNTFNDMSDFDLSTPNSCYNQLKTMMGGGTWATQTPANTNAVDNAVKKAITDAKLAANEAARQFEDNARNPSQGSTTPPGSTPGNVWQNPNTAEPPSRDFLDAYIQLQIAAQLLWQVEQCIKEPQQTATQLAICKQLLEAAQEASDKGNTLAENLPDDDATKVDSMKTRFRQVEDRLASATEALDGLEPSAPDTANSTMPHNGDDASLMEGNNPTVPNIPLPGAGGTVVGVATTAAFGSKAFPIGEKAVETAFTSLDNVGIRLPAKLAKGGGWLAVLALFLASAWGTSKLLNEKTT
jgi:hypothetical protein